MYSVIFHVGNLQKIYLSALLHFIKRLIFSINFSAKMRPYLFVYLTELAKLLFIPLSNCSGYIDLFLFWFDRIR